MPSLRYFRPKTNHLLIVALLVLTVWQNRLDRAFRRYQAFHINAAANVVGDQVTLANWISNNYLITGELYGRRATACSATAIGPHACLTAAHCYSGSDIYVDIYSGSSLTFQQPIADYVRIDDGADHTIVISRDLHFPTYAHVVLRAPVPGETLMGMGTPAGFSRILRSGMVIKNERWGLLYDYIQMPTIGGDSGMGLYDAQHELVAVYRGTSLLKDRKHRKLMISVSERLHFTQAELDRARTAY
jgi:hypothetical protein